MCYILLAQFTHVSSCIKCWPCSIRNWPIPLLNNTLNFNENTHVLGKVWCVGFLLCAMYCTQGMVNIMQMVKANKVHLYILTSTGQKSLYMYFINSYYMYAGKQQHSAPFMVCTCTVHVCVCKWFLEQNIIVGLAYKAIKIHRACFYL